MEKLTGLCVLFAALSLAVTEDAYFAEGGTLTLDVRPAFSEPIKHILWKIGDNLLAEWVEGSSVDLYRSFKGRTTLNTKTGQLVINNMSQNDTGEYSADINSNVKSVSYTAKWIKHVPKPMVRIRTLTCAVSSEVCNVSCDGDTKEAEPVTYSWKMGAKDWEGLSGKDIQITDTKNGHDQNIACRMTNPIGKEVSETVTNPLYREHKKEEPSNVGAVIGAVIGAVFGVLFVGVVVWLLWKYKKLCWQNRGSDRTDTADKTASPPDELNRLNKEQPPPSCEETV
ncbi:lymphocyte function-associated antigen 3-like [Cebidichthys violaceus]|uniref:lymphocyte function-associated antigen 3-like n=1 Tax=Cebidichthys violaceus TaxID=271503 RepID=UPI0035CAF3BF